MLFSSDFRLAKTPLKARGQILPQALDETSSTSRMLHSQSCHKSFSLCLPIAQVSTLQSQLHAASGLWGTDNWPSLAGISASRPGLTPAQPFSRCLKEQGSPGKGVSGSLFSTTLPETKGSQLPSPFKRCFRPGPDYCVLRIFSVECLSDLSPSASS